MTNNSKNAVLLTGAAARISQEVAILDKLMEHKGLKLNENQTVLSGFSSGSMNLLAINACFRKKRPLDWDAYYKQKVLFSLKTEDVFKAKFPPFDTRPLLNTLNKFLIDMYSTVLCELSFHSYIPVFSRQVFETLWASSRDEGQKHLFLSDILMASTAIPFVFPCQEIECETGYTSNFPGGKFNDGGTEGTFSRFEDYLGAYVAKNGPFENLYIISPMREKSQEEHILMLNDIHRRYGSKPEHRELKSFLSQISMKTFVKFLERLEKWETLNGPMAQNIYVSIPEMDENFPLLDFSKEEKQYKEVCHWLEHHPDKLAIPLAGFLEVHKSRIKEMV